MSAAAHTSRIVVKGKLKGISASAVLQALSISRQLTMVSFLNSEGSIIGKIALKSGMFLSARVTGNLAIQGTDALRTLLQQPIANYIVERLPPSGTMTPVGPLTTEMLTAALSPVAPPAAPTPAADAPRLVALPPPVAPRASAVPAQTPAAAVPAPVSSRAPAAAPPMGTRAPAAAPSPAAPSPAAPSPAAPSPATPSPATQAAAVPPVAQKSSGRTVPIVAVTSPKGGSGKTTIALNLGVSLAVGGLRVVIVDTDPNSDILSAVTSRHRAQAGLFEYLSGGAAVATLPLGTAVPGLKIVPACAENAPYSLLSAQTNAAKFSELFRALSAGADIIIVDTAAGMFGSIATLLPACTHVVGVLATEGLSGRSFGMFQRAIESISNAPAVLGIVVNMARAGGHSSADATAALPKGWSFKTYVPRSEALLDAADRGLPIRFMKAEGAGAIAHLFSTLAGEVRGRLQLHDESAVEIADSFIV